MEISPVTFYPVKAPPKYKVNQRVFSVWKEFTKQQYAIDQQEPNQRIFSFQYDHQHPERRKYLLTTLKDFWTEYSSMDDRHFYELLQDQPCHLYFDLEFEYEYNKEKNVFEMLSEFKKYVLERLEHVFGMKNVSVVQLDSTTTIKFSKHVLFRSQDTKFKNNIECGYFVKDLMAELDFAYLDTTHDLYLLSKLLHVKTKDGDDVLFIDKGVYSRNRNFRLWLSSKMEKKVPLELEPREPRTFETFLKTLVCDGKPAKLVSLAHHDSVVVGPKRQRLDQVRPIQGQSPFTSIESRLLYFISEHGSEPFIKSFIHYPESNTILFVIGGNRYCHRVQREHKSNSVYYIVDLSDESYYQKCYDPDCHGYKSPVGKLWKHDCDDYFDDIPDEVFQNLPLVGSTSPDYFQDISDEDILQVDIS